MTDENNDIDRQQPMPCIKKFNSPLAILFIILLSPSLLSSPLLGLEASLLLYKMVIISRRSLSHFRDVKNNFLRCSRIKGVTRGSTRFRAVLDKLSKFHSAVPHGV